MSSSALLVSEDASRARSGILTPTSEGSLNLGLSRQHGASSPRGDARKSGVAVTMEQLLKPSIAVKVKKFSSLTDRKKRHQLWLT